MSGSKVPVILTATLRHPSDFPPKYDSSMTWWFILFLPKMVISTRNAMEAEPPDWTFLPLMLYGVISLLFIYLPITSLRILLTISLTSSSLKCSDFLVLKTGDTPGRKRKILLDVSTLNQIPLEDCLVLRQQTFTALSPRLHSIPCLR